MTISNFNWAKTLLRLIKDKDWWSNREHSLQVLDEIEAKLDWYIRQCQKRSCKFSGITKVSLKAGVLTERETSLSPLSVIDGTAFIENGTFIGPGCYFSGNIYIGSNVYISAGVVIEGPAYIGNGTMIGPNCFLNAGVYLGQDCHIGQGAEIKSSILLSEVKMYHFSYVGHSIIGHRANIAAGAIISVRRFDGQPVGFSFGDQVLNLGEKGGALIGDDVQLGVGTLIPPGRQICPRVSILPGSIVKRDILIEKKFLKEREKYANGESIIVNVDPDKGSGGNDSQNQALWIQVSNLWDKEADRFWTRNNILLLVNGGLIALLSTIKVLEVILIISILGILLSILWLWINTISKYYLNRWKPILVEIEKTWPVKPISQIDDEHNTHPIPLNYEATSTYMRWTICTLGVFWVIVLIACLFVYFLNIDLTIIDIKRLALLNPLTLGQALNLAKTALITTLAFL